MEWLKIEILFINIYVRIRNFRSYNEVINFVAECDEKMSKYN